MTEINGKGAEELLAEEVMQDFLRRREDRRLTERGWTLNMNFVNGSQYCDIDERGEIYEQEKKYFWEDRRVFNHLASTVELRCSKLGRVRPALTVRAAGEEESDRHSASLASAILASVSDENDLDGIISDATVWSETCGTAFYKVVWDGLAGGTLGVSEDGRRLRQGDVCITAVSPFEIYPYSLSVESIAEQPSLIHARAVPVQDIYSAYGVRLAGGDKGVDMLRRTPLKEGYELVIERYERPTEDRPSGRLTAVAGGVVLYDGPMPYINGDNGTRTYPFVKQISLPCAGCFFGTSVVARLIPLQRAYNAVKNRKHEFLNRLSMGTVAVEDGSVDIDELAEDGLVPGKIIVYRQGGTPPHTLALGSVPSEFSKEEEGLLKELTKVSGTGEIAENADGFAGITSAAGLQLVIEQDEIRMDFAYGQIKRALRSIGRQILRLYRQFAGDMRLLKFAGKNGGLSVYYFKGGDISSDDVYLEADGDANLSPAQRRAVIYELVDRGLFSDAEGRLSVAAKNRLLELIGYKGLGGERDLGELNRTRAGEENLTLRMSAAEVKEYDDHATHIAEHTAFLLTERLSAEAEERICAHIKIHKEKGVSNDRQDNARG